MKLQRQKDFQEINLRGQLETLAFYREQQNRELYLQQLLEKNIYAMESCFEAVKEMNAFYK